MNKKSQIIGMFISLILAISLFSVASNFASQIKPVAITIESESPPISPKEILSEREMLTWKNIKKLSIIPYDKYQHVSFIEIYEYMDVNGDRYLITATRDGAISVMKANQRLIPAPPIELIIEK